MSSISRRSILTGALTAPFLLKAAGKRLPVGLELFSVRNELAKDPMGTIREVAKMGYEVVEFFSPYYSWTKEQATDTHAKRCDKCLRPGRRDGHASNHDEAWSWADSANSERGKYAGQSSDFLWHGDSCKCPVLPNARKGPPRPRGDELPISGA